LHAAAGKLDTPAVQLLRVRAAVPPQDRPLLRWDFLLHLRAGLLVGCQHPPQRGCPARQLALPRIRLAACRPARTSRLLDPVPPAIAQNVDHRLVLLGAHRRRRTAAVAVVPLPDDHLAGVAAGMRLAVAPLLRDDDLAL